MDYLTLLNDYSLIAVLVGVGACILTGVIKLPIKRALNKKVQKLTVDCTANYVTAGEADRNEILDNIKATQKKYNDLLKTLCTLISVFFAGVGIVLYHVFTNTLGIFTTTTAYTEIITGYVVAELVYTAYEKLGAKTLIKYLMTRIKDKAPVTDKNVDKVITLIENILAEDVKLPLTIEQQNLLREKYTEKKSQK